MSDDNYAHSKYLRANRYASVTVVVIAAGIYASRLGTGYAIRAFAVFVLPLVLIWFADELAEWAIINSGGSLSPRNADIAVRIAGWLILIFLLIVRCVTFVAAK
jgi:hypothetical protein